MLKLRKSQAVGLKELIATLVVSGILLMIGVVVFAKVRGTIDQSDMGTDANNTVDNVETTTYDSFELATVALIVLAAAVIIGILIDFDGIKTTNPTEEHSEHKPSKSLAYSGYNILANCGLGDSHPYMEA